ncbi:hypothetical protein Q4579_19405 [Photobacterium sp. 1_MG-2023]|nr:hypothetical protein [Photobacterium sp. 1_MG-2023]
MEQIPYCKACGQDEEFIVIDEYKFVCVCGYQFTSMSILPVITSVTKETNPLPIPFEFHIH